MNHLTIDILCRDKNWSKAEIALAERAARRAFAHHHVDAASPDTIFMTLVFADGDFIRSLNHRFRHIDRPTNVLAFPASVPPILGDVILARDVLAQEARGDILPHIAHIAAHGTLHLLGWTHENDSDAREMEQAEIEIMSALGFANPYDSPSLYALRRAAPDHVRI